jgi:hypothetical protein
MNTDTIVKKPRTKKSVPVVETPVVAPVPIPVVEPVKVKRTKKVKVDEPVVLPPVVVPPVIKVKTKRVPSQYNIFVKEHMAKDEIKALEPKSRFAAISALYKTSKAVKA